MTKKIYKCCICGGTFEGYGNNPYPLCDKNDYESRCCNECDTRFVVIARLVNLRDGKQTINKNNAPDFVYACATTVSKEKSND